MKFVKKIIEKYFKNFIILRILYLIIIFIMLKKIFLIILVLIFSFWYWFWSNYTFTHYPLQNSNWKSKKSKIPFILYSWTANLNNNKINIKDIKTLLNRDSYFKYFQFSYYWKNTFIKIFDKNIDLWYLDELRLNYPIIAYYIRTDLTFIIPQALIKNQYQKIIWNLYSSDKLYIEKFNWFYFVKFKLSKKYWYSYDTSKYVKLLESLNKNINLLHFQIWQNPFNPSKIENMWNNLLQVEIVKNKNKVKWVIFSMDSIYQWFKQTKFSQNYYKDSELYYKLLDLIDVIKIYYYYNSAIPNDIWKLDPTYYDVTSLNLYWHTIFYKKIDLFCYEVWFTPFSKEFINLNSSYIKNWEFVSKFCIK